MALLYMDDKISHFDYLNLNLPIICCVNAWALSLALFVSPLSLSRTPSLIFLHPFCYDFPFTPSRTHDQLGLISNATIDKLTNKICHKTTCKKLTWPICLAEFFLTSVWQ